MNESSPRQQNYGKKYSNQSYKKVVKITCIAVEGTEKGAANAAAIRMQLARRALILHTAWCTSMCACVFVSIYSFAGTFSYRIIRKWKERKEVEKNKCVAGNGTDAPGILKNKYGFAKVRMLQRLLHG